MAKSTTIVLPCRYLWTQLAVFQYFGRLVYEPKRVTALSLPHLESILDIPWTHLGQFGIGRKQASIRHFIRPFFDA